MALLYLRDTPVVWFGGTSNVFCVKCVLMKAGTRNSPAIGHVVASANIDISMYYTTKN